MRRAPSGERRAWAAVARVDFMRLGGSGLGPGGGRWHRRCGRGGAWSARSRPREHQPSIPNHMNKQTLKGNWNIAKGKLKQRYANLTDDDLDYVEGKEDELYGRIQKRTGETREQIERIIEGEPAAHR